MATFDLATGITAVNTILVEEANRISQDIYNRTLHITPWRLSEYEDAEPESKTGDLMVDPLGNF